MTNKKPFVVIITVHKAYWVMTQAFWLAALKTDGPITGNITGSCHICK